MQTKSEMINRIAELEKENAELKEALKTLDLIEKAVGNEQN